MRLIACYGNAIFLGEKLMINFFWCDFPTGWKHFFKYINISNFQDYIEIDQKFTKNRVNKEIYGIIDKAKQKLNWTPQTSILSAIEKMIDFDIVETKESNKIFIVM